MFVNTLGRIIYVVFALPAIVIGCIAIYFGFTIYNGQKSFESHNRQVTGTISYVRESRGRKSSTVTFYSTVRFTTRDGRAIAGESQNSSGKLSDFVIGQKIPVYYDTEHPEYFRVNSPVGNGTYFFAYFLWFLGGMFVITAIVQIAKALNPYFTLTSLVPNLGGYPRRVR